MMEERGREVVLAIKGVSVLALLQIANDDFPEGGVVESSVLKADPDPEILRCVPERLLLRSHRQRDHERRSDVQPGLQRHSTAVGILRATAPKIELSCTGRDSAVNSGKIVEEGYDKIAQLYHKRRIDRYWTVAPDIEAFAKRLARGSAILYVGCGSGFVASILEDKGFKVTGIDVSTKMLELAKSNSPRSTSSRWT